MKLQNLNCHDERKKLDIDLADIFAVIILTKFLIVYYIITS